MNKRFSILPLLILFLIIQGRSFCQSVDSIVWPSGSSRINKSYIKSYFVDSWKAGTSPVRWNKVEWLIGCSTIGVGLFLITQDEEIRHFFQMNRTSTIDGISHYIVEPLGSGVVALPGMGLLYGAGLIFRNDRAKATAFKGIEAFLISSAFVQGIKLITHRSRPYVGSIPDAWDWQGPDGNFNDRSFPSGHTAAAFSVATVLGTSYKETVWIPLVSYSLASLVGLSRMNDDEHWASDVFVGAVLGYAIGKLIMSNAGCPIRISPSGNLKGVALIYRF